jgi:hypothetical protein
MLCKLFFEYFHYELFAKRCLRSFANQKKSVCEAVFANANREREREREKEREREFISLCLEAVFAKLRKHFITRKIARKKLC